jgi:excisionase family DNA binding protein
MSTIAVGPRLVLTVEEAAERLGIGRTLMYALVKAGVVESICIGRLRQQTRWRHMSMACVRQFRPRRSSQIRAAPKCPAPG